MRGWTTGIVAAIVALAACQGAQPPVPVMGDVAALAGRWEGEYGSRETGRAGSILFTLEPGTDTAHGEVLMVPRELELPPSPRPGDPEGLDRRLAQPPQALPISFVRATDGRVEGRLAPYRDPDCGCLLTTSFIGRLIDASTFEGTFTSIAEVFRTMKWGWLPVTAFITQRFDSAGKIDRVKVPVLVVHGSRDRLIRPDLGQALYERAGAPKKFVLVEGGSHYSTNAMGHAQYREAMKELFGL